jgi:hypothetical protein
MGIMIAMRCLVEGHGFFFLRFSGLYIVRPMTGII